MVPLFELERAYEEAKSDPKFRAQLQDLLKNFAGRPTPLQFASRLTEKLGGPRIYLKREDLLHTGAHKINNASARVCSQKKWASRALSPKPARVNTALRQLLLPRISGSTVFSIWARKTWPARRSTSPACACSARKSSAWTPGAAL